jgi:DNA polymerase-3 subunit alpha
MFDMFSSTNDGGDREEYPEVFEFPQKEKLQMEKDTVGFYLSGHPLDPYEKIAQSLGAIPTTQLSTARHMEEVLVAGVVSELKERPLKSGKGRWAVVILEDSFGQAEILCFSNSYEQASALLRTREPLLIKGRALIDDADDEFSQPKPKMRLMEARLLADAHIDRTSRLHIDLTCVKVDKDTMSKIHDLLQRYPGDKPIHMTMLVDGELKIGLRLPDDTKVRPSDELLSDLENLIAHIKVERH